MLFQTEFFKVVLIFFFNFLLGFLILGFSFFFSTSKTDVEKVSSYECGFDPYEDARNVFDIQFYLVALLFLIFDLESVYFFPWCVSISFLDSTGILGLFDFLIELLVGLSFIWDRKVLNWQKK